jgi:hypothetical protein
MREKIASEGGTAASEAAEEEREGEGEGEERGWTQHQEEKEERRQEQEDREACDVTFRNQGIRMANYSSPYVVVVVVRMVAVSRGVQSVV